MDEKGACGHQEESAINVLKAWEQVEQLSPPPLPKRSELVQLPMRDSDWEKLLPPKDNHLTCFYTCYLYAIPIKDLMLELNKLAQIKASEGELFVSGETFIAAFRIDENGCPIEGACKASPIFDKMQKLQINLGEDWKPATEIVSLWYRTLFQQETRCVTVERGKNSRAKPVTFNTAARPFSMEDFSSFERSIRMATPDIFVGKRCICLPFLRRECYSKKTLTEGKVKQLPLDSFYLNDLKLAMREIKEKRAGKVLRTFLWDGALPSKVDWLENLDEMFAACSPGNLPAGHWPGDPKYSLYLAQQAAVNVILKQLDGKEGMISVNGPPGTGKTTLLRDIIASLVVRRAERLASLEYIDDLFDGGVQHGKIEIFFLKEEFAACEEAIVVASSNNRAVENISNSLPKREEIGEEFRAKSDYFGKIAEKLFAGLGISGECWSMLSAALGNQRNCQNFAAGFWFPPSKKKEGERSGLKEALTAPASGREKEDFLTAKKVFLSTLTEYKAIVADLKELEDLLVSIPKAEKREAMHKSCLEEIKVELTSKRDDQYRLLSEIDAVEKAIDELLEQREEIRRGEPKKIPFRLSWQCFLGLFQISLTKVHRQWKKELATAGKVYDREKKRKERLEEKKGVLKSLIDDKAKEEEKIEGQWEESARVLKSLKKREFELKEQHKQVHIIPRFSKLSVEEKHLSHPWSDENLNRLRSRLFLQALDLHRAAIFCHRKKFHENLNIAMKVIQGGWIYPFKEEELRNLWASLFMVVPVISTTFASFEKLFSGLTSRSLGWVLVDEAGQAAPQQAVGALCRAKRLVVIGDPMQIEPIVSIPEKLSDAILKEHQVSVEKFSPHQHSVQTIADRNAKEGTWIKQHTKRIWTGIPLRVHMRCSDPMFTISNTIAYGNQMVNGRSKKLSKSECGVSSWYDIEGKTQCGSHGYREEIDALEALLRKNKGKLTTYVITPFASVKYELIRRFAKGEFSGVECGTIHTFQGGEAEVVFLILGGNRERPRAIQWAANKPNILNTAVTRARDHLYVIGNRKVWSRQGCFSSLDQAFDEEGKAKCAGVIATKPLKGKQTSLAEETALVN